MFFYYVPLTYLQFLLYNKFAKRFDKYYKVNTGKK